MDSLFQGNGSNEALVIESSNSNSGVTRRWTQRCNPDESCDGRNHGPSVVGPRRKTHLFEAVDPNQKPPVGRPDPPRQIFDLNDQLDGVIDRSTSCDAPIVEDAEDLCDFLRTGHILQNGKLVSPLPAAAHGDHGVWVFASGNHRD